MTANTKEITYIDTKDVIPGANDRTVFNAQTLQELADSIAELDSNRQMLAVARLRDNPKPTPYWFRKEVGKLKTEQAQASLFDTSIFVAQSIDTAPVEYKEPPHPSTSNPPRCGNSIMEILRNQVEFWLTAASDWDNLGKPFKRQECKAAASALTSVMAII